MLSLRCLTWREEGSVSHCLKSQPWPLKVSVLLQAFEKTAKNKVLFAFPPAPPPAAFKLARQVVVSLFSPAVTSKYGPPTSATTLEDRKWSCRLSHCSSKCGPVHFLSPGT